jgi:hypothetical protein
MNIGWNLDNKECRSREIQAIYRCNGSCRMIFQFYYLESSFNIRNYEVDFNVATRILLCWMLNSWTSIKVNI